MPKKSNKTAHVLNLITGPGEEQPAPESTEEQQDGIAATRETVQAPTAAALETVTAPKQTKSETRTPKQVEGEPAAPQSAAGAVAPPPRPTIPILQSVRKNEQILSEKIRDDLTAALESALAAEAPAPVAPAPIAEAPAPVAEAPAPIAEAPAPIAEAPAPVAPAPVAPAPVAPAPAPIAEAPAPIAEAPAPIAEAPAPIAPALAPVAPAPAAVMPAAPAMGRPLPGAAADEHRALSGVDNITYTNVTQSLVEENAMHIIKQFSQCRCNHCIADIKALALNALPPKYVVMQRDALVPMFSVYESRLQAQITAGLTRACLQVNQSPRH